MWEQRDAILRGSIAGNNDRRFQMVLGYNLAEMFCLIRDESRESKVSDDQYISEQVFLDQFVPGVIYNEVNPEFCRGIPVCARHNASAAGLGVHRNRTQGQRRS